MTSPNADGHSAGRFRALLANVADMVTLSDRKGRIVYANPATEQVSGYTPEEFMEGHPFDTIHPEDRPRCEEAFEKLIDNPGLSLGLEHRIRHRNGSWRWVEGTFTSLFDDPEVGGLVATVRDITGRRRAESSLRVSEEKYRTLFDSMDEGYAMLELIYDADGRVTDFLHLEVNPAVEKLTGLEGTAGKRMSELAPIEEYWLEMYGRVAATGEPERLERYADGLGRWFSVHASRVGGAGSRLIAAIFDDITERKQRELRQKFRLRLSDLLRSTDDAEEIQEQAARVLGQYLDVGRAFYFDVEREPEDHVYVARKDYYRHPDMPSLVGRYPQATFGKRVLEDLLGGETLIVPDVKEHQAFTPDELDRYSAMKIQAFVAVPLIKNGVHVAGFVVEDSAPQDWTAEEVALVEETAERTWAAVTRARAEAALRESEARYRAFVTASSDVVYRMGPDWTEMRRLYGRGFISDAAEPTEHWMEHYIPADDWPLVKDAIDEAVRAKRVFELEHRVRRVDGTLGWVLSRAVPVLGEGGEIVEWLGTASDVTTRRAAEKTLHESEERQVFQLKLSDALRPLADPEELQEVAARMLGERLGANLVHYGETIGDHVHIGQGYGDGLPPMVGRFRSLDFGERLIAGYRRGDTQVSRDTDNDPAIAEAEREVIAAAGFRAYVAVPLVKGGEWVATLAAHSAEPRDWTANEVKIVEETAERTWAASERAHAASAWAHSEEQYRMLFASIDEGFCTIEVLFDERGKAVDYRFLEANPAFERQTGLHNAVGKTVRELAPEHEAFWFEIYGQIARTGEARRFEHEAAALGRFYDVYAFRIGEPGEDRVAVIFNDILARKRAEEERERVRALEASVVAEAAERERISRELHDRVAHHMGVAHQSLELYVALKEANPEKAAERLDLARETTRIALDQTRDLSAELKRLQEEELADGLRVAFERLADYYVSDGTAMDVSISGEESRVSGPVGTQVYLTMREAIKNAIKHSGGSRIVIRLEIEDGELLGLVEDDGEGFEPDTANTPPSWGVGLRSMRERAKMLGGGVRVDSEPGEGTRVEMRVPLDGRR